MAEALAVVAIISSIVQLVDFTSKVVTRLDELRSDTSDAQKSLGHLKAELPVLVRALQLIEEAINSGLFPKGCATALVPVVQGCEESIREINSILAKTLLKQSDGRTKKVFKSIGSVWNDGKIESIAKALRDYTGTLTFYFAASSSTLQPLTVKTAVEMEV
ncbi:hypothetical protein P153DRAFT_189443 [Dothidotthia symphoricarpi CBS 119687]|uniref:NACHT-NTPase and P-loop NTPases N-terminal domain-containing protein n=1 Tax=Dothidotthia symphoricarpi CBS 119687 TaxID=1392245 RepID=A0A6A6AN90_9PLEO|nr:uncharacterized protein P153DRAFT_189443 [Dothidotthia symphoricarpi CBS 119687]KAF2132357.1 hypothetical protein P153DRAFT_189443 [Dothidotthia symphoricarpi CBS 119687]